jgi:chitinase
MRILVLWLGAAACLWGFQAAAATPAPANSQSADSKVIGYYIGWARDERSFPPEKIDATKLTHINYAFANVVDGQVVLGRPKDDLANFAGLRALKKVNPALKLLVSVGGWEWSAHFSDVALTPASRKRFADSAVNYMLTHQLDGVDIDWEFPVGGGKPGNSARPQDKRNFTLLLQAVRKGLDTAGKKRRQHYLLTIATNPGPDFVKNTELAQVAKTLDWINIMGYDFNGPWGKRSGPLAPLVADPAAANYGVVTTSNVSTGVEGHLKAGVPLNKIVLGVPFYGYVWQGCANVNHGEYQECTGPAKGTWEPGSLEYSDIATHYLTKPGFTRHWNAATKTPSVWNPEGGIYIAYEDAESLGHKLDLVQQKKLAGVMIWEITTDRSLDLLTPIAQRLLSGQKLGPADKR